MHIIRSLFATYISSLIILVVSLLVGIVLHYILMAALRRYAKRKESVWAESAVRNLTSPLRWFLPFLIAVMTIRLQAWELPIDLWITRLLKTILYISTARVLIEGFEVIGDVLRDRFDITNEDNLEQRKLITQLQFIKRMVAIVVITLTASIILLQFDSVREIGTGLLTSAGVAGVIIGFAAQKSLANLLAGFQIAFTQPIRIDDAVIVEGEWGQVEEITLTYVVIRIWDKRRLVVPLQYFIEKPFQNWTRTSADLIGVVMLYVDYQVPVSAIRQKLSELLAANPRWDGKIQAVQVTDAKPQTIEVRMLMGARNAPQAFDLRCEVREAMIEFIQTDYPESLPRTRVELHPVATS